MFIAIRAEAEVLECLESLQKKIFSGYVAPSFEEQKKVDVEGQIRNPRSPFRKSSAQQLHITLQFLGDDVTLHQIDGIRQGLSNVAKKSEPFSMRCVGMGAFPENRQARVIWAGVRSAHLQRLVQDIRKELAKIGFVEKRGFSPHVTIARSRYSQDATGLIDGKEKLCWCEKDWSVRSFSLIESVRHLDHYEHTLNSEFELGK